MGAIAEVTRGLPTRQTSEGPRGAGSSGDPVLVSRVSDSEVRRPSPLSLCAKRSSGGAPGWAFWWELAGQRLQPTHGSALVASRRLVFICARRVAAPAGGEPNKCRPR
jgi:hypothetical protein